MDNVDDCILQFLTPEALRDLDFVDDHGNLQLKPRSDTNIDACAESSGQIDPKASRKRDCSADHSPSELPPSPNFHVQYGVTTCAKRAKFNPERRAEVAELRKQGVCFRCKISKTCCSKTLPCRTCVLSWATTKGRKSERRGRQCIAFALEDADLFAIDFPCTEQKYLSILQSSDRIVTQDLEIAFESLTLQDVSTLARDVASWLSDLPVSMKPASRFGILASSTFQRLLSQLVEDNLSKYARLLVEVSFALRSGSRVERYAGHTVEELRYLQSFTGTQLIRGLDIALKNPFNQDFSIEQGQALFLTLFSAIIAVANYSQQPSDSLEYMRPVRAKEGTDTIQQQLLQILTHHLIHMADRQSLLRPGTAKDLLLQNAASELTSRLSFQWQEVSSLGNLPARTVDPTAVQASQGPPKRPRQALLLDVGADQLLPLEPCRACSQRKRWINLENGICLDCRLEAMLFDLPSRLLSISKIMANQDRAAYPMDDDNVPSHLAERHSNPTSPGIDSPEPEEPIDGESQTVNHESGPQLLEAVEEPEKLPIWEMCVWCDSQSGSDGLCDTCRNANNTYNDVDYTKFSLGEWYHMLESTDWLDNVQG